MMVVPVLLSVMVSMAFAAGPASTPFQPATAGYQYTFPRDHGSHPPYRTEWWYYTGHLQSKNGRAFGFELTFFRRGVPPEDILTIAETCENCQRRLLGGEPRANSKHRSERVDWFIDRTRVITDTTGGLRSSDPLTIG
ncbi:MAG: hypothetical protein HP496_04745 [Nitrospira sp.]|nr:hypothetical protein [Nitrospira sp.]